MHFHVHIIDAHTQPFALHAKRPASSPRSNAWNEDSGDGSGDVYFHLDPLWADPEIDFVGIDNYMPLSDWRDGFEHLDAAEGWPAIYDRAYLQGNIAGGEGFDRSGSTIMLTIARNVLMVIAALTSQERSLVTSVLMTGLPWVKLLVFLAARQVSTRRPIAKIAKQVNTRLPLPQRHAKIATQVSTVPVKTILPLARIVTKTRILILDLLFA